MNGQYRPGGFAILPVIVKNLLIINGLFFLAKIILAMSFNYDLDDKLGIHYFASEKFEIYQVITHMFMHGDLGHIFFNMFAVWMFGSAIENTWGPKRFLTFYLITGLGAAFIHYLVVHFEVIHLEGMLSQEEIDAVLSEGAAALDQGKNFIDPTMRRLNGLYNIPLVGASGALFGLLLAFGMLFPNTHIFLFFIPIPIKAKYFVAAYGAIELFLGFRSSPGDNIAHFAHLGGMLFGYLLIRYWRRNGSF